MKRFLVRHQPTQSMRASCIEGLGGILAIGVAGACGAYSGAPLIMAPFGATCVLLFSVPQSPLSQPANVIGGHFLAALIGVIAYKFLPYEWWSIALAVGVAIAAMSVLRLTHPPAGASPIVVFADHAGWSFVTVPVLVGAVMLVLIAIVFHRMAKTPYPLYR